MARLALFLLVTPLLTACLADHRAGSPAMCDVHNMPLRDGTASIQYGASSPEESAIARRAFPQANTIVQGGCVISGHDPTTALVRYCPACRQALSSRRDDVPAGGAATTANH